MREHTAKGYTRGTHRQISPLIQGVRQFSLTPSFDADTFEEDVAWELGQLRRAGHDRVVLVDLTLLTLAWLWFERSFPGWSSNLEPQGDAARPAM